MRSSEQAWVVHEQRPQRVVGDKGYSSGTIRRYLRRRGIRYSIPRKANEKHRGKFDKSLYRQRNQVERCFNRLKQYRRIATRYEKNAENYLAMLTKSFYPVVVIVLKHALAPFSEFGAEYGFVAENRRLRFVQLYDRQNNLSSLTLIREFRSGTDAHERPPLTVEQLLGQWQGTACTVYADWQPSETYATRLAIQDIGGGRLQQQLSRCERTLTSIAQIAGNILKFEDGPSPRKILLLPDGTSSNTPLQLKQKHPFFVEVGWLVADNERQRLIRSYNEKGEWISATHVIEHRVG